ncbi:WD40 repeat-like protein [Cucurbitaria berberidis CBS 394.84]|uniref:WD40 repeat-like protein n=1 Tax=Cucurbitaria berberidis CBS 394.84 TaxID=1168544 RepID=A0A9P4GPS9_9PLEO|nr:WD40 repeat-like protein [Cucurbitaria berberidis CBS 394.84]KAF1850393.1 WD40 repeat-like protein [Cucurbitaria berberidis CBS 394.84]
MTTAIFSTEDLKIDVQFFPHHTQHRPLRNNGTPYKYYTTAVQQWRRVKVLGKGGFGMVWLEKNTAGGLGEERAVKEVSKFATGRIATDYNKELVALARLSQYDEHFVNFMGWYENEHTIFLAMEYFPLGDLAACVTGPLSEDAVKEVTVQLIEGLNVMHTHGFAHRDLKPQNIFVLSTTPKWRVKIGDFGISKRTVHNDAALTTAIGSIGYVAPEILGCIENEISPKKSYSNAVDIWSLGCVVYWMLTTTVPFTTMRDLFLFSEGSTQFPSSLLFQCGLSVLGHQFLKNAMALQPARRFNAKEALQHPWLVASQPAQKDDSLLETSFVGILFSNLNRGGVLAISPDGRTIAFGLRERNVLALCDAKTRGPRLTLQGHAEYLLTAKFSPDGKSIATAGGDRNVLVWDTETGAMRHIFRGHFDTINDLSFSPDGSLLASASDDRTVRIWDVWRGRLRNVIKGHYGSVSGVAFSPVGSMLATASSAGVWLYLSLTGMLDRKLEGPTGQTHLKVSYSPDGKLIAASLWDNQNTGNFILLYDSNTGQVLHKLTGHTNVISSIAFSNDGSLLASAACDNTARLWSTATGSSRGVLKGHTKSVWGIEFGPAGQHVVTASEDGTVRVWELRGEKRPGKEIVGGAQGGEEIAEGTVKPKKGARVGIFDLASKTSTERAADMLRPGKIKAFCWVAVAMLSSLLLSEPWNSRVFFGMLISYIAFLYFSVQ